MRMSKLGCLLLAGYCLTAGGTLRAAEADSVMRVGQNTVKVTQASLRGPQILSPRKPLIITIACTQAQSQACGSSVMTCQSNCGVDPTNLCLDNCHKAGVECLRGCGNYD